MCPGQACSRLPAELPKYIAIARPADKLNGVQTRVDTELIERKFSIHGLGSPPHFQKFVCGKKLYNYDNLEPSERKLVL